MGVILADVFDGSLEKSDDPRIAKNIFIITVRQGYRTPMIR
jgi:hypothetical protein